jgi:DUF438 domain-containing protein
MKNHKKKKSIKRKMKISTSFATIVHMSETEKQKILAKLLQDLKEGKSEDEVKQEYLAHFGEDSLKENGKDNWTLSSSVNVPKLQHTENHDYEEENPLVVFAQENGALKALLDNIAIDLNNEANDQVGQRMLKDEFKRLSQIEIHFSKKHKILFEFLEKYEVETLTEVRSKDEEILRLIKDLNNQFENNNPYIYREEISHTTSLIREGIAYENHFLLPILDERLNEDELFYIQKRSDIFGYCLIRHRK